METAAIIKGIKRIADRGTKQAADVQAIGLACIEQVANYGQTTYLGDLYNALGKGDKDAFGKWALTFGGVKANLKKDSKARLPFVVDATKKADTEAAAATEWQSFQPEPKSIERLLDEGKAVNALIGKLCAGKGFKNADKAREMGEKLRAAMTAAAAPAEQAAA